MKIVLTSGITALIISVAVLLFGFFVGKDRLPSMYNMQDLLGRMSLIGEKQMNTMMSEMMGEGHGQAMNLPTRTPADRVERLAFELKGGVKEFHLTAEPILWEYAKGKTITAWGYNGQVPGPEIRVNDGDRVSIVFENKLPKATTIHWHGIDVPNDQDGVPGVTQQAILPGQTYTYEFTAKPAGTRRMTCT